MKRCHIKKKTTSWKLVEGIPWKKNPHFSNYAFTIVPRPEYKDIYKRKVNTEQRDEIGVAVESWLWARVELMAW